MPQRKGLPLLLFLPLVSCFGLGEGFASVRRSALGSPRKAVVSRSSGVVGGPSCGPVGGPTIDSLEVPGAWEDIMMQSDSSSKAVLKDGELDFMPWLKDFATSPHDPELWEEDGSVLGQGAFGVVGRGVNRVTGELVAIKRIAPMHPLAVQTAVTEIDASRLVGEHPNIVQLKAHYLSPEVKAGKQLGEYRLKDYQDVMIVYRLALGGSLEGWILQQHVGASFTVDYSKPLLTDESLRLMRELTGGLQHIHSRDIQHRDLKPANILLSAGGTALIADFGIALVNRSSGRLKGHAALGDFYFIDVDALVNKGFPYCLEDDIYSLAEVFVRMLYGPHATGTELRQYAEAAARDGAPIPEAPAVLDAMLAPRGSRSSLEVVLDQLHAMGKRVLRSEPRRIVTEVFLGIGAVVTAGAMCKRSMKKRMSRKTGTKSTMNATVRIGALQGKRRKMQDFYCHSTVKWLIPPKGRSWRLLGLFDGHGGTSCARFAARFLPHEVRRMLRRLEDDSSEFGANDDCSANAVTSGAAARALLEALESLDTLYMNFKKRMGETDLSGSTAAVALLSPSGRTAILGNIGDSYVALGGDWEVESLLGDTPPLVSPGLVMAKPHSPADPAEQARIERAGGFVELGSSGHRVNGVLGVARAIGYGGVPEFAGAVTAKGDVIVARRRGDGPGLVALSSDGVFSDVQKAMRGFNILSKASTGADLELGIEQVLAEAGGPQATDNISVLACLLPGA